MFKLNSISEGETKFESLSTGTKTYSDVPVEVRINGFYNLLINGNSLELLTLLLTFYQPPGTSKYVYVLFYTMGSRPFLKYHAIFWDY